MSDAIDPNDWSDWYDDFFNKKPDPPTNGGATFTGLIANGMAAAPNGMRERSYALSGLRRECEILAAMPPESGRNNQLNNAIFSLSGFVPQTLSEEEVVDNLGAAALSAGLPLGEAQATIRSALRGSKVKGVVRAAPPPTPDWFTQVAMSNLATPPVVAPVPVNTVSQFFGTTPAMDPGVSTANGNANAGAEPDDRPLSGALGLEAIEGDFWTSRESLITIYEAALARFSSPWAVLGFCAARALALVSPRWTLPPIIGGRGSLNWFSALASRSGGGKGAAQGTSAALIPRNVFERNLGSGEGLISAYKLPKEKGFPQAFRESVMFIASEVEMMRSLGARTGSTLMPMLRQAFSGETLGFTYRIDDTHLRAHTYRLTYVCGVQPETAGPLLDDVHGGTPQRFMWFPALDRRMTRENYIKDFWVPTLELPTGDDLMYDRELTIPIEAENAIIDAREAVPAGDGDPMESHAIFAREKFAFALAILDGRVDMTLEDWELSGVAAEVSTVTRNWVIDKVRDTVRGEAVERGTIRGIEHAASERGKVTELAEGPQECLRWAVGKIAGAGAEGIARRNIDQSVKKRLRPYLAVALESAKIQGMVRQIEGTTRWVM